MNFSDRMEAFDDGNGWPIARLGCFWLVILVAAFFALQIVCFPVHYAERAAQVVSQEIDPAVLLQKYMWFKDAHAALDQKQATIKLYTKRLTDLKAEYKGIARGQWPAEERETYNQWYSELDGIVASYNDLAATYNAQMVKINWRFTNVGGLPQGATEPLPRDYAPYTEGVTP